MFPNILFAITVIAVSVTKLHATYSIDADNLTSANYQNETSDNKIWDLEWMAKCDGIEFMRQITPWDQQSAREICETHGMKLATFNSKEQFDCVRTAMAEKSPTMPLWTEGVNVRTPSCFTYDGITPANIEISWGDRVGLTIYAKINSFVQQRDDYRYSVECDGIVAGEIEFDEINAY